MYHKSRYGLINRAVAKSFTVIILNFSEVTGTLSDDEILHFDQNDKGVELADALGFATAQGIH